MATRGSTLEELVSLTIIQLFNILEMLTIKWVYWICDSCSNLKDFKLMYSINIFSNSFLLDIAHIYINTENLS